MKTIKVLWAILLFTMTKNYGQHYLFQSNINLDIEYNAQQFFKYAWRYQDDQLYIISPENNEQNTSLQLIRYYLQDQKIEPIGNISASQLNKSLKDYIVIGDIIYYYSALIEDETSFSALYQYDLKENKENILTVFEKGYDFSKIEILNDSLVLLHNIYPFHPADGLAKAQLYIFNVRSNQITHKKHIDFEGISFANIVHEWVYVNNGNVYVVMPFSGGIKKYDAALNLIEQKDLTLPSIEFHKSKEFANYWDHLLYDVIDLYYQNENNDLYAFFSKESIQERMTQLREQHIYIEKIMPYDEHTFILSLYQPATYQKELRDLFFIDHKTLEVKHVIEDWRAMAPINEQVLNQVEDYFTIDLGNSRLVQPFFYKDKVYTIMHYPISLFEQGLTKKEMDLKIFRWRKENQLQFGIGVYQLP